MDWGSLDEVLAGLVVLSGTGASVWALWRLYGVGVGAALSAAHEADLRAQKHAERAARHEERADAEEARADTAEANLVDCQAELRRCFAHATRWHEERDEALALVDAQSAEVERLTAVIRELTRRPH